MHDPHAHHNRKTGEAPGNNEAMPHHDRQQLNVPGARGELHAGHDKHRGHSVQGFRDKFWVSLALTIPTVVWGHMLMSAFNYTPPAFPGSTFIPVLFGTAVFVVGGLPFLNGAIDELKAGLPGMMTLIGLAISVAFIFSAAVTMGFPGTPLWEELATLVTIMLLGHWIEMRSVAQAQGAVKALAKLLPTTATRVLGDRLEEVEVTDLAQGDTVLVRPGASIPADGIVVDGHSSVNEAMITGESAAIDKGAGDKVIAGTINQSGALRLDVTGTGERTALAGIMRLVTQAQASRSRAQAVADRAALALTVVALASGAATLIVWLALRAEPAFAIERAVTVLVIACPHALGLAVPLVIAISTSMGAQNGVLVRDRRGLEEARSLNTVVFDKTGTLTLGEHQVVEVTTIEGLGQVDALRLAAAIEKNSEHPVALAIVRSAEEKGLAIPSASNFEYVPGRGVRAVVEGRELSAGGPNLLLFEKLQPEGVIKKTSENASQKGQASIFLVQSSRVVGVFIVADAIRPESRDAVARLHADGLKVVMLTGDAQPVADAVAKELGIDEVFAEVLPADKARHIEELRSSGEKVAMVGDGVNDAPALIAADVGIAIGAGTDVAVEAGDIVLVRNDPRDIARIISLSRATYQKMIQNLWWAAGYNIVAIPLAAGVLASRGLIMSPAIGAVLMSLSTVIVALNAQLLRRARL